MKRYRILALILCLIIPASLFFGCKTPPTTPVEDTPTAVVSTTTPSNTPITPGVTNTYTQTFTPSSTESTGIVTPTFTPTSGTPTVTDTDTPTSTPSLTVSISVTDTFTPSMTPTITNTMSCQYPHISVGNYKVLQQTLPDTTLYFSGACKPVSGTIYKAAVYDHTGGLVAAATAVQTACGELRYTISVPVYTPTNMTTPWHVAIMEQNATPPATYSASAPEFTDTDQFYVMEYPPMPTPTAAVMNMADTYAGYCPTGSGLLKENNFKLSACDRVTFINVACTQAYTIAFYDGGNQLRKAVSCGCPSIGTSSQAVDYVFDGTETAGLWHVDLFGEFAIPPQTWALGTQKLTFQAQ